ncbi:MAG: ATP-binding protein, partial [Bacillota bacterium]|nr:ATP-binding protein [Bacillota bacterium]
MIGEAMSSDEISNTVKKKRILILIITIVIFILSIAFVFAFHEAAQNTTEVKNGTVDLKNWNSGVDQPLNLNGNWDFYWNRFVTDNEIESGAVKPDSTANVPAPWNSYTIGDKNLPSFGYGTYAIKVLNATPGQQLALNIPALSTAYELYVDGSLIASNGKIGTSKETYAPEAKPQVVEFSPKEQNFDIVICVSNFTCVQGGMLFGVQMGTWAQIHRAYENTFGLDSFLLGLLFIVALYYIGMFFFQRETINGLYTSFMCLWMAVITMTTGNVLILRLIPSMSYGALMAIEYISLCWIPVSVALTFKDLFPEEMSDKVTKIFLVFAAAMTLLILLTPNSFYSPFIYCIEIIFALISAYCFFMLSKAYLHGRKDSFLTLVISLIFFACSIVATLFTNNASEIGFLIILLPQPFVISRRLSDALQKEKKMSQNLLSLDKLKDEFLANTSHELRTPLNGIHSIAESMLRDGDGELNEHQRSDLTLISLSSRRLTTLVNDILDYAKLKNGNILLNVQPVHIEGPIYTIVSIFRQINSSENVEILFEFSDELPPALADEGRLTQIIYNLMDNAVKFTVSGYVKISVKEKGNMLEFCVADTGQGIPEDKFEAIFKSFEQVDTSSTRGYGGTGLGLPITKYFVELMGGKIWVISELGVGSAFTFTIPIAPKSSGALTAAPKKNSGIAATKMQRTADKNINIQTKAPKILLVDDDTVNLQAASSILRIGGFHVITAHSGLAALAQLEKVSDYSLAILDVMMPEMSGFELCREIRKSKTCFELPVLMLTARTAVNDIVMGFEVGANDYLAKPFEPEELLARAKMLTGLKESVD